MTVIELKTHHLLHAGQQQVHDEFRTVRFGVLVAGRRWRKTSLGVIEALEVAANGGRAWWVAPTYQMAGLGWDMLLRYSAQVPGVDVSLSEMSVALPSRGVVRARSADKPNALRGEGLDLVVLDEAALIDERVWTEVLRPALTDRQGKALFISTFNGRNWFWRLWTDAGRLPQWKQWLYTSASNPHLKPEELHLARQQLPEVVYRQEYECQPSDDAGAVFRNVEGAATATEEQPRPGRRYVAGLDLGRAVDWTVLTVADALTRRVVHMDRWTAADWGLTYDRVARTIADYQHAPVTVDASGIGDVIIHDLQNRGVIVQPFVFTGGTATRQGSKTELINALVLAIESETIRYPRIQVLLDELASYTYILSKAGNVTTGAPEGYHDDCVISLALCNWGLTHGMPHLQGQPQVVEVRRLSLA